MVTQSLSNVLPAAAGVALSPIPIVAVVLMLGTPRARSNGPAFALGWVGGLLTVSAIVLTVSAKASDPDSATATGVNGVQVAIGVLFLVMAARQWRKRPAPGTDPEMPSWMQSVDHITAGRALGLGVVLSAVNPKNLALTAAAAASIAQADLDATDTVVDIAVFVIIGSLTVVGPVLYSFVAPDRAAERLASLKAFMAEHNAVIMMVVLVILGVKILGDGLGGFGS